MIPVKIFANSKSISEEEAIELVRSGSYSGRKIDGEWFIINAVEIQPTKNVRKTPNFGPFLKGCKIGLIISLIFGFFTYPWSNPNFEGGGGFHLLAMIFVVPFVTMGFGIVWAIYAYLFKSNEKAFNK
jgi:hypothetical protein